MLFSYLIAEADMATTIAISSQVKDKNCIFTGYQTFVTGKMSFIFFGGGGVGYFWEVLVGVHRPPHLILHYKVINVREFLPGNGQPVTL